MTTFDGERFRINLLAAVPQLRAYARALCRDTVRADDLVQEALLRAWEKRTLIRDVDRMLPWLLSIMRNAFLGAKRRSRREAEDPNDHLASMLTVEAAQEATVEYFEVLTALNQLPDDQRQAISLVYVQQLSYAEAASVVGCALGTLKSRVARGRESLATRLGLETKTATDPATLGTAVQRLTKASRTDRC